MWTTGLTTTCKTCNGLCRIDTGVHAPAVERNLRRHGMTHPIDPMPQDEYQAALWDKSGRDVARVVKFVKPVLDRTVFGVMWPIGG